MVGEREGFEGYLRGMYTAGKGVDGMGWYDGLMI